MKLVAGRGRAGLMPSVEELRTRGARAGACDRAAGCGGCVPVDGARPARGAVGRASAQARRPTCRCSPPPRRATKAPSVEPATPAGDAAQRACRERLPDRATEPEGASDAIPARAITPSAGLRHRRATSQRIRNGKAAVDRRAGADPPAAGQRQGRVLHHAGGRDRSRQPRRLARRVRQAAQDRHGRAADGGARHRPERRG